MDFWQNSPKNMGASTCTFKNCRRYSTHSTHTNDDPDKSQILAKSREGSSTQYFKHTLEIFLDLECRREYINHTLSQLSELCITFPSRIFSQDLAPIKQGTMLKFVVIRYDVNQNLKMLSNKANWNEKYSCAMNNLNQCLFIEYWIKG